MIDVANPMFDVIQSDLEKLEDRLKEDVASPVEGVTQTILDLITSGGKRIRPALCLLASHGGPKFDLERTMPMAEAMELIHTASLVHDDVIDESDTRRGTATANARWGNQVAILAGDYVFARAFSLIADGNYDAFVTKKLAELVSNLSIGEIIQDRNIYQAVRDVEDYYSRIQKKTADFLETCCELGAWISDMEPGDVRRMAEYGHDIGMAFQITDDCLDIVETEATTGKPTGNDIRQGILTLPVIHAMEVSTDAAELQRIVTDPEMTDEMAERALVIVRATDGVDFAKDKADAFLDKARAALPENLPPDIREAFLMVVDFIGDRDF